MKRWILAILMFLGTLILVNLFIPKIIYKNYTYPGLRLEGYNIGKKPSAQLNEEIEKIAKQISQYKVEVKYKNYLKKFSYTELGINPDIEETRKRVMNYGREKYFWQRWASYYKLFSKSSDLKIVLKLDKNKVNSSLNNFLTPFIVKPIDAQFVLNDKDQLTIQSAIWGDEGNINAVIKNIEQTIVYSQGQRNTSLIIPEIKKRPKLLTEDLANMHIDMKLSETITYFDPQKKERANNIKVAAGKLDNVLIPSGKYFSFNESVGPRTKEAGYQEALVIVENEFENGLGGGVCQVSSTLYNAVLRANFPIIERRRHSLPIKYVSLGLDATVNYGTIDFKFLNNTANYILIKTKVVENALVVKIFGHVTNKPNVQIVRSEKIISPSIQTIKDPNLPLGKAVLVESGKDGYIVEVYRIIKDDMKNIITKEFISKDIYQPKNRIVRIGSKVSTSMMVKPNVRINTR
ncbi:VanW family protein [Bacillota bacterium LX-D]|nr:VanW family protein [Bacillota bacterium LX-D]